MEPSAISPKLLTIVCPRSVKYLGEVEDAEHIRRYRNRSLLPRVYHACSLKPARWADLSHDVPGQETVKNNVNGTYVLFVTPKTYLLDA